MASGSKISPNEVHEVVTAIDSLTTEKAKELFYHLKVQLKTLDDIDTHNQTGNMRKVNYVQAWYDNETDANWDKIVTGLKLVGMNALAESLAKQKIISSDFPSALLSSPPVTLVPKGDELTLTKLSLESPDHPSSTPLLPNKVAQVKASIEDIEELFFSIVADAQTEMTLKERVDPSFLKNAVDRLLALPVAQKSLHVKFFRESEDDLLKAENVRKLIAILKRYCNSFNYEIMQVVIRKFCAATLQDRMQEYCKFLETFERGITVDIYLEAISAGPVLSSEFQKMVMALDKPANQCTLYEVRKLKETIAERASLQPYSVFIGDISEGSVKLELGFPASCTGWILGVMTPDFLASHHISQVSLGGDILIIEDRPTKELNDVMMEACTSGDLVRVASLLNSGANVQNVDEAYVTPLIRATVHDNLDVVRFLASRGAHLNYMTEKAGATALIYAAFYGLKYIVRELISLGADLNIQNTHGVTAVIEATARYELDSVLELVNAKCDLNLQTKNGLTALMIAARGGEPELINILLQGDGIHLDLQDNMGGWTALHLCAENGDSVTTHALIRAGANIHIKAKNGWTALEIAEVKSVDEDTQFLPDWDEDYVIPYRGERDYETVMELLRGNITTLSSFLLDTGTKKKKSFQEIEEKREVLKRGWIKQKRKGSMLEIWRKTGSSMDKQ